MDLKAWQRKIGAIRSYRNVMAFPQAEDLEQSRLPLSSWMALHSLYTLVEEGRESALRTFLSHLHEISDFSRIPGLGISREDYQELLEEQLVELGYDEDTRYEILELWKESYSSKDLRKEDLLYRELFSGERSWIYRRLLSVQRYSGISLVTPDLLSDHLTEVALISIAHRYPKGSLSDLLQRALTHDLDEIITGDVPRPLKYRINGMKSRLESLAEEGISKTFPQLFEVWKSSKSGTNGKVIALSDLVSVLIELTEERLLGSRMILLSTEKLPEYFLKLSEDFSDRKYPHKSTLLEQAIHYSRMASFLLSSF